MSQRAGYFFSYDDEDEDEDDDDDHFEKDDGKDSDSKDNYDIILKVLRYFFLATRLAHFVSTHWQQEKKV